MYTDSKPDGPSPCYPGGLHIHNFQKEIQTLLLQGTERFPQEIFPLKPFTENKF